MEQRHFLSPGQPGRRGAHLGDGLDRDGLRARLAAGRGLGKRSDLEAAQAILAELDEPPMVLSGFNRDATGKRPAAVLVPLVDHGSEVSILLTQRTDHLKNHAGQISFPGGRVEAGDKDPEHTALREATEEIGLDPASVDIVGRLDDYVTVTGFLVTPVVGVLTPPLDLTLDPFEVANAFEVPLDFVMDPANHRLETRLHDGMRRAYYAMPHGDRYIWGATAAMLMNLHAVLRESVET
ncbi:MAG: CoA pyrophosphatase [Rhodospirillum sp.]|nr:CoA pyrophosphatase [Rhodospirillum sp.]MCF8488725.1 CoA pyrophosphatase [Rhodospirillum sp.]MCF8503161.1 CoA pyrophosphatase [Rhodospirillum sp.]